MELNVLKVALIIQKLVEQKSYVYCQKQEHSFLAGVKNDIHTPYIWIQILTKNSHFFSRHAPTSWIVKRSSIRLRNATLIKNVPYTINTSINLYKLMTKSIVKSTKVVPLQMVRNEKWRKKFTLMHWIIKFVAAHRVVEQACLQNHCRIFRFGREITLLCMEILMKNKMFCKFTIWLRLRQAPRLCLILLLLCIIFRE